MGRRLSRAAALSLALLLSTTTSAADDQLVVSGQVDTLDGARDGGGLSVDWVRATDGRAVSAGVAAFRLGEARWAYGRGMLARRLRPSWWGTTELRLGRGEESGDGWRYLSARAGVLRSLGARADAEAELQYTDVAHLAGPLARLAATWRIGDAWTVHGSRHQSLGGDLETRLWGYRGERSLGRVRLIAGGSTGHTAPQLLIPQAGAPPGRLREAWGGVSFPLGGEQVTATLGRLTVSGIERWTTTVSYKR